MGIGHQIIFLFLAIRGSVAFEGSFNIGPTPKDPEPQFADVIPNISVVAGSDVTLSCVVDSLGKYKVAWIHSDHYRLLTLSERVITRNPRIRITHDNFRTWSLQILNVSESDSGNYMCQVNTSPMKYIEGNIQVVEPPPEDLEPQFADVLPNITVVAGSDVTLPCVVDSLGKYKVAWIQADNRHILTIGNHVMVRNPRIHITHDNFRTWSLQIQNVSKSDSRNYICQLNTVPMKAIVGNIQVVEPPHKDQEPQFGDVIPNITVAAGSDATLPCVVDSQGKYNVAWIHMDRQVLLTVNDRVVGRNPRIKISHDNFRTWSLQIQNVSEKDSGNYLCQVNTVPMKHLIGNIQVVGGMQDLANGDLENIDTPPTVDVVSGSNKGDGQGRWMWTTLITIVIFCL